jgi:putative restriction endonuclease
MKRGHASALSPLSLSQYHSKLVPMDIDLDRNVRLTAFDWLSAHSGPEGEPVGHALLERGFTYEGRRVPLIGPQGIFKPQILELPLSINTSPNSPYDDHFNGGRLSYRYRGTDPLHRDNSGLREVMRKKLPLAYLYGLAPGTYLPIWPVFVVTDDPRALTFDIEADDGDLLTATPEPVLSKDDESARRSYVMRRVRVRMHQQSFRRRVLDAYRTQCAICRLRYDLLLDAAHIIPDSETRGEPIVKNGLALCKLHHAAFDRFFLSVTADYRVKIRRDILNDSDGPMLQHGLKELEGVRIQVPRPLASQPDKDRLSERHKKFLELSVQR